MKDKQITEDVLQGRIDSTRGMINKMESILSRDMPTHGDLTNMLQTIATNQVVIMQYLKERMEL